MTKLTGKTVFITGASRGIGAATAIRCAKEGANVVITGKTSDPHPKLSGTIHSVAEQVEAAGGKALAIQMDIRFEDQVAAAIDAAVGKFGGIDILINNASAINIKNVEEIEMKQYDLLQTINSRGTFITSKLCIPHLKKSDNPHVLTLSPPLNMHPRWLKRNVPYTLSKYSMTFLAISMAELYREANIAFNCLWPKTLIAIAAIEFNFPPEMLQHGRKPEIMAEAILALITRKSSDCTGECYIDEEVLRAEGMDDFSQYAVEPGKNLLPDFYID